MITLKRVGRRTYFLGNAYEFKDILKHGGAHWDADSRAWWMGNHKAAEALLVALSASTPKAHATYSRLPDNSWGLRGKHMQPDGRVTVKKKDGSLQEELVDSIVSTDVDGWQVATIKQKHQYYHASKKKSSYNYCGYPCPVSGRTCNPVNGPCHDCE